MKEERYLAQIVCQHYQLKPDFLEELHEFGIIRLYREQSLAFVEEEELPRLEKAINLHSELGVNLEGIQVVFQLLERIEHLQQELRKLRHNQIGL